MAKFHRLTSISDAYDYVVGGSSGSFPVDYDYVNNNPVNTQAAALGPRTTLPYNNGNGTYFIGLDDDATSEAANRPHKALAENDDYLDNLLHRAVGVPGKLVINAQASSYDTITIPATEHMWGGDGSTHRYDLVKITDEAGDCIFDMDLMQEVRADIITPTPGDSSYTTGKGFATTDVQVVTDIPIPAGKKVYVHYLKRGCLADLSRDALLPAVKANMARNGSVAWDIAHNTNDITALKARSLGDVYNLGSNTYANLVDNLPERPGSVIRRTGAAPTVYSLRSGGHDYSYDAFDACWKAVADDAMGLAGQSTRTGGTSCFVAYGNYHRGDSGEVKAPTVAGLWTLNAHMLNNHPDKGNFDTYITWDGPCTISYDGVSGRIQVVLTGADDCFWRLGLGIKYSTIATGVDVLMVYNPGTTTGAPRVAYIIDALDPSNAKRAFLRRLDGSDTAGIANFTGTVRWLSTSVVNSLGTAEYWNKVDGTKSRLGFSGFQYLAAPTLDNAAIYESGHVKSYTKGTSARFFANSDSEYALEWGGRSYTVGYDNGCTSLIRRGGLKGDGTLAINMLDSYTEDDLIEVGTGVSIQMTPLRSAGNVVESAHLVAPFILAYATDSPAMTQKGKVTTATAYVGTLSYFHTDLSQADPGVEGRIKCMHNLQFNTGRALQVDYLKPASGSGTGVSLLSNGLMTTAVGLDRITRVYNTCTISSGGSSVSPAVTLNMATNANQQVFWIGTPVAGDWTPVFIRVDNLVLGTEYNILFDIGHTTGWYQVHLVNAAGDIKAMRYMKANNTLNFALEKFSRVIPFEITVTSIHGSSEFNWALKDYATFEV